MAGAFSKKNIPVVLTIELLGGLVEELLCGGTHLPGLVEDVRFSLGADEFHQKDVVAVPLILLVVTKKITTLANCTVKCSSAGLGQQNNTI